MNARCYNMLDNLSKENLAKEVVLLSTKCRDLKRQLEQLTVDYYNVKRQNDERAEIIKDLLIILEIDSNKLRQQLESRCIDDGK